jgi:hypothetical protein
LEAFVDKAKNFFNREKLFFLSEYGGNLRGSLKDYFPQGLSISKNL